VEALFSGISVIVNAISSSQQLSDTVKEEFFMQICNTEDREHLWEAYATDGLLQTVEGIPTIQALLRLLSITLESIDLSDQQQQTVTRHIVMNIFLLIEEIPATAITSHGEKSVYLAVVSGTVIFASTLGPSAWILFESSMFEGVLRSTALLCKLFVVDTITLLLDYGKHFTEVPTAKLTCRQCLYESSNIFLSWLSCF
jgi:hypothetical protein